MSSAVKTTDTAAAGLAVYRLRDDLVRVHRPVNEHEMMLVTQIAQSWLRLQRAYDAEQRYFESRDILDAINTKLIEFKTITRYVTDCERAWRHATQALDAAQRRRRRETLASPNARRAADRIPLPTPQPPVAPSVAPVSDVRAPRRE